MLESRSSWKLLPEGLARHEEEILNRWTADLRHSGIAATRRREADLRRDCGEALRAVQSALRGGDLGSSTTAAHRFARVQLEGGVAQSEMILLLFHGRHAMVETLRPAVPPAAFRKHVEELDHAVSRVITLYGNETCSVCMSRQDERRVLIERQLESVIDRSRDGIVLMDADGRVQSWNPGAESLFGFTREEMLGRSLDAITPPQRLQGGEVQRLMAEVSRSGHGRLPETERQRKDGARVWVDVGYTAVPDSTDGRAGMWAVFRDITERKMLEESKLQSERLALIGTMSAKLAHEVRNPLTSIVLNLDLIQDSLRRLPLDDSPQNQENREMLGAIESEVQRIHRVVEDYLRFARLPRLRFEPVELDALLSRHLAMMEAEIVQRGIQLRLELGCPGEQVQADEEQMWQALLNLVRNALEAMPGGGQLSVSTRRLQGHLECRIEDSGNGMPDSVREKIFQPFFSTKPGGTGLGLPLTQQIILEHGAQLACESAVGAGTAFRIQFPRIPGAAPWSGSPPAGPREAH